MDKETLGDRLFRALLRLFPAEFRGDFGDDMSADFRDQRLEAWRRGGTGGVMRVWLATILDALKRAPREQAAVLAEDAAFAVRIMRKHLVSTAVIVTLLAIGIGANVAVFGFAEPWVRRPLPVPDAHELVRLVKPDADARQFSHAVYTDLRQRIRSFAGVAAHQYTSVAFGQGESAVSMDGEVVSGNYFDVLRVRPRLGRMLQPSDDAAIGAHPVAVISFSTWRDFFASAPDVVGRVMYLNGHAFEIVGVAPQTFSGSYTAFASRFWAPIAMYKQVRPQGLPLDRRGWTWLSVTARMRPGVSTNDALAELAALDAELQRQFPTAPAEGRYELLPASGLPEGIRQSARTIVTFASAIAALLLLVTCANVAGVLQSRAMARLHETSIRFALGATRLRIIRQWLTESVCLALIGAGAGLLAARWIDAGVVRLVGEAAPYEVSAPQLADMRIVIFTIAVGVATGIAFGLFPAWRAASRGERALREHATTLTGTRWGVRSVRALVALQVTASIALVVTAGLLTRSIRNAATFDVGFQTSGLVGANLNLQRYNYDQERGIAFVNTLLQVLRSRADVVAASHGAVVPLSGEAERLGFRIPGYKTPDGRSVVPIDVNAVGTDYFATIGIPVLEGRDFAATDDARASGVAIVNATMAARYWPGRSAVGQTIMTAGKDGRTMQIVGVVRDIKYYSLDEPPRPYVYFAADQADMPAQIVHVRTRGAEGAAVLEIKRAASDLNPAVVVDQAMPFEELRRQPLAGRRAMMVMTSLFGGLALVLTLVGIYGTMANAVAQRSREIGVRIAFGAGGGEVFGLIMRDGLPPVVIGTFGGLAAAGLLSRLVASELFGVTATDPLTHVAAVAAVLAGACGALALPARRAARVDPITVLKE
jgi:predicted permease